jgi:hypothetical protein
MSDSLRPQPGVWRISRGRSAYAAGHSDAPTVHMPERTDVALGMFQRAEGHEQLCVGNLHRGT